MLNIALTGALIALSFSAPPGPVAMETVRRGLRGGFGAALRVQFGSIFGDVMWCVAALIGLAPLVQIAWVRGALGVAGVGLLLYLGAMGLRDALRPRALTAMKAVETSGAFRSGLWISMANPMAVGYWLGVGGALTAAGVIGQSAPQTLAFISGFVAGTLVWALVMASLVRWGRALITPALFRWVALACGLTLIGFGLALAAQMLNLHL